jgi:hypothetical protein
VVKKNKYNLVAAKEGFLPKEKEIIGESVNLDVRLDPKEGNEQ